MFRNQKRKRKLKLSFNPLFSLVIRVFLSLMVLFNAVTSSALVATNSTIQEALWRTYKRTLANPFDLILVDFISQNAQLNAYHKLLEQAQKAALDDFARNTSGSDLVSSAAKLDIGARLRSNRGLDAGEVRRLRVYQLLKFTMLRMGFSKETIDTMQIKIAPDNNNNAFTVSGNQNQVIIVITKSLLEASDVASTIAVLAHELGHIIMQHPINGIFYQRLFAMMAATAISSGSVEVEDGTYETLPNILSFKRPGTKGEKKKGDSSAPSMLAEISHEITDEELGLINKTLMDIEKSSNTCGPVCSESLRQKVNQVGLTNDIISNLPKFGENISGVGALQDLGTVPEHYEAAIAALTKYLMSLSVAARVTLFRDFLKKFRDNKANMELSPDALAYLEALDLKFAQILEKKPHSPLNNDYVLRQNGLLLTAISRAQETSADNISAGIFPNEKLIQSMLLFQGVQISQRNEGSESAMDYRKRVKQAIDDRLADLTAEVKKYGLPQNTEDHPSPKWRIMNILSRSKFPDVVLANPFLQLLAVEDQLETLIQVDMKEYETKSGQLRQIQQILAEIQKKIASGTPLTKEESALSTGVSLEAKQLPIEIAEIEVRLKSEKDGFEQVKKLVLDKVVKSGKGLAGPKNPYWNNLMAYTTVVREFNLRSSEAEQYLAQAPADDLSAQKSMKELQLLKYQKSFRMPIKILEEIDLELTKQIGEMMKTTNPSDAQKLILELLKERQSDVKSVQVAQADELESLRDKFLIARQELAIGTDSKGRIIWDSIKKRGTQLQVSIRELFAKFYGKLRPLKEVTGSMCSNIFK